MSRWDPNARMRLVRAAVDQCYEQGYEATTVARIAERAGLTRATFFRHFPDKREVFFAGQAQHSELLVDGIRDAPPAASPVQALEAGLSRLAESFTDEQREFGPRLRATVTSSVELQERDALKNEWLAGAATAALIHRGVDEATARVAGELGVLAIKQGFERWSGGVDGTSLEHHVLGVLGELRLASATLA